MSWNQGYGSHGKVNKKGTSINGYVIFLLVAISCLIVGSLISLKHSFQNEDATHSRKDTVLSSNVVVSSKHQVNIETQSKGIATNILSTTNNVSTSQNCNGRKPIKPHFGGPTATLEDGTVVSLKPQSKIRCPMERALAAVASPGGMPIPFRAAVARFSEREFMEMLNRRVEFSADDSDVILEKKLAIQDLKKNILDYINDGHSLLDAIDQIDKEMRQQNRERAKAYRALAMASKTGDAELISAYVEQLNKSLTEKGIRPINVPPKFRVNKDIKKDIIQ